MAGSVAVVIDAQRGEFYVANYEFARAGWRETQPLRLATPSQVEQCEAAGELLIGPDVTKWFPAGRTVYPGAAALARLAAERTVFVSGEALTPVYLREAAFVKAPPSRVLPP